MAEHIWHGKHCISWIGANREPSALCSGSVGVPRCSISVLARGGSGDAGSGSRDGVSVA